MRLVAEELEGRRGGQTLFAGLGFALSPGEAILVKGPNGAGKSTLLRIAAGLLPPARGRLALEGGRLAADAHYLSAQNAMKPALTVGENLGFWRKFFRSTADEVSGAARRGKDLSVTQALAAVGLAHAENLPFAVLSTGQRRRTALARLLLQHRPLWLLDEPGSGLDAASQAGLSQLLISHLAGGGLVLAAVHDDPGLERPREVRLGDPAARTAD